MALQRGLAIRLFDFLKRGIAGNAEKFVRIGLRLHTGIIRNKRRGPAPIHPENRPTHGWASQRVFGAGRAVRRPPEKPGELDRRSGRNVRCNHGAGAG